jgi:hypothetical protein
MARVSFMKNQRAARQRFAAVLGLSMLVLTVAVVDARKYLPVNEPIANDDADFLTLNPEAE